MFGSESAILFHGPSGQEKAYEAAHSHPKGRFLKSFGSHEEPIKAAVAREVVELMSSVPVGDQVGVLLIGPLDTMHPAASDVLLKALEEFNPSIIRPVLWAEDIGSVRSTIVSRCLGRWCPGPEVESEDTVLVGEVEELVDAALEGDVSTVAEKMNALQEHKDRHKEILRVAAVVLARKEGSDHLDLWKSLRGVMKGHNVSFNEALAGFLLMGRI